MASTMGVGIRQAYRLNDGDNAIMAVVAHSQAALAAMGRTVNESTCARALSTMGFSAGADEFAQSCLWRAGLIFDKIREQQSGS